MSSTVHSSSRAVGARFAGLVGQGTSCRWSAVSIVASFVPVGIDGGSLWRAGQPFMGEVPHPGRPTRVAGPADLGRELGTRAEPELGEGVRDVVLDGLARQEQARRDLRVRGAERDEVGDLALTFRERAHAAVGDAVGPRRQGRSPSERKPWSARRRTVCGTGRSARSATRR